MSKCKVIKPFEVGKDSVILSHFQFAYDTLLFHTGKDSSFFILNHVLAFFEEMPRLKINRGSVVFWVLTLMRKSLEDGLPGSGVMLGVTLLRTLASLLEAIQRQFVFRILWWIKSEAE